MLILYPGQEISMSDAFLPRTAANGYKEAGAYMSGRVVQAMGGGICQVSSTLYAAMLIAGIPATQHYLHSLPVDYVPRGLDAAIVEGYKDLKFKNNFDYPIVLHATTKDGTLTVSITKQ